MNLSGIAVTAAPAHLDAVTATLATLPGVEVHAVDPVTGRIVVVQEAVDVAAEVEGFRRIRSVPHVIDAALVVHRFDPPTGDPAAEPVAEPAAEPAAAPAAEPAFAPSTSKEQP